MNQKVRNSLVIKKKKKKKKQVYQAELPHRFFSLLTISISFFPPIFFLCPIFLRTFAAKYSTELTLSYPRSVHSVRFMSPCPCQHSGLHSQANVRDGGRVLLLTWVWQHDRHLLEQEHAGPAGGPSGRVPRLRLGPAEKRWLQVSWDHHTSGARSWVYVFLPAEPCLFWLHLIHPSIVLLMSRV